MWRPLNIFPICGGSALGTGSSLSSEFLFMAGHIMKNTALLMILIVAAHDVSSCESPQPLSGTISVPVCLTDTPDCRPAGRLLYEYTQAQPDDPASFSIAL